MGKRIPILLGLILLGIAVWLQITTFQPIVHFITRLQNLGYDMQLRARLFTHHKPLTGQVAIVDIDDKSIAKEGRWPWSRSRMAQLVNQLHADGAVVVAFDIIFPEPEENIAAVVHHTLQQKKNINPDTLKTLQNVQADFDFDTQFAKSLTTLDSILGISFLPRKETSGILPTPLLTIKNQEKNNGFVEALGFIGNIPTLQQHAKSAGFINVFPDDDGIIRRVPILIRYQDGLYPSLALEAVNRFLLTQITLNSAKYLNESRLESVSIGNHIIPTDSKAEVIVPYRGLSYTFPYFSASDVLHKKIPPDALQGKIIFIGTSATGLGDLKAAAIQNIFPGVEIQATIAAGILDDDFSERPAWATGAEIFLTFFPGILFVFLFPFLGPRTLILCAIILPFLYILANSWVWEYAGLILFVFMPIVLILFLAILNMIYGYFFESRKREQLHEMFGQYVPERHIDEMLTGNNRYSLYGEDREMTVLFADIRNFTTISENLSATELKEMLNSFFTPMTEIIFHHNGTIDKYVGDMIMAFWGAPLSDAEHTKHGIEAAIEMQQKIKELHPIFAEKKWPEIHIGIGLNSGFMRVGDMGSRFRRSYTVLGDAVNLASRVENLTKFYGANLIVTENTRNNHENDFIFRKLDCVRVKGKKNSISIYEVLGKKNSLSALQQEELAQYNSALDLYFSQQWQTSHDVFIQLHHQNPDKKIYKIYAKRTAEYLKTPPHNWEGVYTHVSK
ncbi:MAG: adenylate/guanylate cyclase domain-containing protein [Gammaproteobacteria bacterium]|nr:adenylate/guanylate cyclase domain-containing protein [Gammaproteobacteria bacterium]